MLHCTCKFKKHGFCINSDHLPISMVNMNYYTSIIKSQQAVFEDFSDKRRKLHFSFSTSRRNELQNVSFCFEKSIVCKYMCFIQLKKDLTFASLIVEF